MPRGGKRVNAGRKTKYSYKRRLAIANEVADLIQRGKAKNKIDAIRQLIECGKIDNPSMEIKRYLTPKYFSEKDMAVLIEHERKGILSVLPKLSTPKPKV